MHADRISRDCINIFSAYTRSYNNKVYVDVYKLSLYEYICMQLLFAHTICSIAAAGYSYTDYMHNATSTI